MIVSVFDGDQFLETRECRLTQLEDGRRAAIWRGLAFPLLSSGDVINVAGEAHPPDTGSGFGRAPSAISKPGLRHALVEGKNEAYVLIAGSITAVEQAASELRQTGVEVLRTGRYLGDMVDQFAADWFIRVAAGSDGEPLRERVARVFGRPQAEEIEPNLRLQLLVAELSRARERALRSETEVAKLKLALAEHAFSEAEAAELRSAVEAERQRREEAEAEVRQALAQVETLAETLNKPARQEPPAARRIRDEVSDVLATLLPRIRLLRDGLDVIAIEFADRRGLYRVLAELDRCETAMPTRWKTVQGADGWIEKSKVSNGQDDQGRVYARLDRTNRSWEVLISHKSEQGRDIAWLIRQ